MYSRAAANCAKLLTLPEQFNEEEISIAYV
jgi:hypothetical protein